MIISVSRRCDIPRFQFDWFMERLNAGFVDTANPFNAKQIKRIPLIPVKESVKSGEGVDAFVFWTRDPKHILSNADELQKRGFPFYVMVSLTGYPALLEPDMSPAPEVIASMKELALKIGAERVIWRYDPVIYSCITDDEFHHKNFFVLAQDLSGYVNRVIVSIYDKYKSAEKRFAKHESEGRIKITDADEDVYYGILSDLAGIAKKFNIEIQSCAEKRDFSSIGIKPGACIDAALIEKIRRTSCNETPNKKQIGCNNQRPCCLCCKSTDIGAYKTCKAGCVYCYAS